MIFQYQALNSKGDTVTDFIDATGETQARQKIRALGLYPVKIVHHEVTSSGGKSRTRGVVGIYFDKVLDAFNRQMAARQVGIVSRQLSTLLKAGLPLPTALGDVVEQIDNRYFRNIMTDVKEKIEEGSSLSAALSRHGDIFSDMYVNMVRVGENLGSLEHVIERLSDMEEKKNILKSRIRAALWYPSFMLLFAILIVIFLMVTVIPSISEVFLDQQKSLPLPTRMVIGISDFMSTFWFLIPLLVFGVIVFYKRYAATPEGRRKIDEFKLKIPLVKNLYKKLIVFRFTQNLGILMNNRVDILKSFEIVQKIVGNCIVEEQIASAAQKVREGSSISAALSRSGFLPKLVLGMIAAGEASDNLDTMMLNIGHVYETELDLTITSITSLIEPVIIIIMGVAIGTIVMSVMLPIMQMNLLLQ